MKIRIGLIDRASNIEKMVQDNDYSCVIFDLPYSWTLIAQMPVELALEKVDEKNDASF